MKKTIIMLVSILLLTSCGLSDKTESSPTMTNNSDQNVIVVFEDKKLEAAIRDIITDGGRPIRKIDLNRVEELELSDESILSLKGLEYCENLKSLVISRGTKEALNNIKDLRTIEKLTIGNITIDGIEEFSNVCSLKELTLVASTVNSLTGINNYVNLEKIRFEQCKINALSGLDQCDKLKKVSIDGGEINSLSGCEESKSIEKVEIHHIDGNCLKKIGSISSINKVMSFDLSQNDIASISDILSFLGKAKVESLKLAKNKLKNVDHIGSINFASHIPTLSLDNNKINNINGLKKLKSTIGELSIINNQISDLRPLISLKPNSEYMMDLFMRGNPTPISYGPVASYKFIALYNDEETVTDFYLPKKEIVFQVNGYFCLTDVSPIEKKGEDIFVSPKYLLFYCGYKPVTTKKGLTLTDGNNKIMFSKDGRTMTYKGKNIQAHTLRALRII